MRVEIEPTLPRRGGQPRALTKEDFSGRGAIYLQPTAQFDHFASLPESADRAKAIIDAMESIEADYTSLEGTLPKSEYTELDNDVLGNLLRVFNDPALQKANGDVFGRIYEYFLTQFADLKAHDGGEFFTPISLVQLIVNVIEPDHGKVLDPACGSGGMFVQSAHFIESLKKDPTKSVTFYGMEKNPTTIRLAKMNLAVHGLEGRINKAISYYEDPHEMVGKADFVMANPPFNVDEIDARQNQAGPAPALRPARCEQRRQGFQRELRLDFLFQFLPQQPRSRWLCDVLTGFQRGRPGSDCPSRSDQERRCGRHDRDTRQLLLHTHGALRALVSEQGQTDRAREQGADA